MKYKKAKIKDFIFNSIIVKKKYIFSELKKKLKFINKQRRHMKFFFFKKLLFFNLKDFMFYKYICKCIFWQI